MFNVMDPSLLFEHSFCIVKSSIIVASGTIISSWTSHPSGCIMVAVYVPEETLKRYLYVSSAVLPSPIAIVSPFSSHIN